MGASPIRIALLLKQVPEVSEQSLDPATGRLRRDGVELLMNPFDRRASLECARIRDEIGSGELIAVTMGPPAAESILRECLAIGFDRAIHLQDAAFAGADTLATARALGAALDAVAPDLVLAGRYSIDSETGQVPGEVAALLDLPLVPGARRLSVEAQDGGAWLARAECENDDGAGQIEVELPALATCTDRWKSRIPRRLPDEELAAQARVEVWNREDLGLAPDACGAAGSPTSVEEIRPVALDRRQQRVDMSAGEAASEAPAFDAALAAVLGEIDRCAEARGRQGESAYRWHSPASEPGAGVLVVGELEPGGAIRPVTFELLAAADAWVAESGGAVLVHLIGSPLPGGGEAAGAAEIAALGARLGAGGADFWIRGGAEEDRSGLLESLLAAVEEFRPAVVLGPATSCGRDQLPWLAAKLGLGLTGDAIGLERDAGGELLALKPAFGGQLVAPIRTRTEPAFATLRPGVLERPPADPARPAARELRCPADNRTRVACWSGFEAEVGSDGADLEEARVIVCAGFGLGSAEAVEPLRELAALLGGSIAGTRRVCDLGWMARQYQIGLSGRSVAPDLYLGFGVRGSFNHTVGLRRAGTVVGVNNNPDADIFAASDLGIVGDAPGFLEALLEALRSRA